MRDLIPYAERCMQTLDALGVPYRKPVAWSVNTTARRWGQCKRRNGQFSINISETLLYEVNDENGLLQTIYHELIHTVPNCFNHGPEWKRWASVVTGETGLIIKRTNDDSDKGVTENHFPVRSHEKKYAVMCPDCGYHWYYERAGKHVQHPEWYRCGACKTTLIRDDMAAVVANKIKI